ncbi:hypothetical protein PGTUg99_006071 [Puccinia graminis f. sp. tritici]|uniref:Uncharacterized protein n=1 Tax=Puccinia graminis f. sp. tritici TaxID=56615 RepID=A0A5B0MC43_PUCGR|nr:hypothetical protein PGTUg99_006071 [Puccinia graminis f. sp. tritici]
MTHRLSAPFLIILMIAIVGLILPDLVHTTASYDAHQVSSQAKAQSVAPKGYNDREARPSSQKPGNGQEATSVYISSVHPRHLQPKRAPLLTFRPSLCSHPERQHNSSTIPGVQATIDQTR